MQSIENKEANAKIERIEELDNLLNWFISKYENKGVVQK